MVEIRVRYEGGLRCAAHHGPSGAELHSDAPVDNHGKGESFSPTDLVATALGTCMLTVMGILARQRGYALEGMAVRIEKHMSATPPRKIARLVVTFEIPPAVSAALSPAARAELEQAAHTCPVRLSIHQQIDVPVHFGW